AVRSRQQILTRSERADADCRLLVPQADRLAADKPKYETAGGGAGEGALAFGTPYAISLAVPLHRDRADARSRCRAPFYPAPPDRSPHVAWHSSCATARGAGSRPCPAPVDAAISPRAGTLLRAQTKAALLAPHASEEAADRVLLPMGRAHDGSNRRSLRPAQHGEHPSLFRPAFARGASFSLRLARAMPRANGRLRCNGSPLARGDNLDCRWCDFGPIGSRANACLCRSAHRNIRHPDRFEALLGDAKCHGSSFSIASPGLPTRRGAGVISNSRNPCTRPCSIRSPIFR